MTPQETNDFIVFVLVTCVFLCFAIMLLASVIVPAEDEAKREPINETITVLPSAVALQSGASTSDVPGCGSREES